MRYQLLHAAARATSQDHDILDRFTLMRSYLDGVFTDGVSDIFHLFAEGQASKHDPQAQQRNTRIPRAKDPHTQTTQTSKAHHHETPRLQDSKSTAHSDRTDQRTAPANDSRSNSRRLAQYLAQPAR